MSAESVEAVEAKIASQGAPVAEKAPVEVPAANSAETEIVEQSEPAADEGANEGKGRRRLDAEARINELTRNTKEAERKAVAEARRAEAEANEKEYWRQIALKNQTQPQQVEQKDTPKTLESFGWDQDKYTEWLTSTKVKEILELRESQSRQQAEQVKLQEREKSYQERVAAYEAAHPEEDYHETVTHGSIPISETMGDFIKESDVGPALGVYFRDNPQEAKTIYALSPRQADRALVRLEAKLSAPDAIPDQPVQITRAPPAPPRLSAGTSSPKASGMASELEAVRALKTR